MKSIATLLLLAACALAQMNESGMYLMNTASGTSRNPASWQMPMIMTRSGTWNFMWMGQGFIVETQQSHPRGGDKLYSPNAFMGMASHSLWGGAVQFEAMISLEPATVTNRSYPLLFQTGETAFGRPLVDAQHPHNFIMSISAQYARSLGNGTTLELYYAPVGDPALGPVAYPHRASASELPEAPLGHHWQDSTHIADNVATVSLQHSWIRLEASGFYGTEPGENRWHIDWGGMNSYSGRLSITPDKNWLFQVSAGRLERPERQEPGDVTRATASLHYNRPAGMNHSWSSSVIWGRNHDSATQHNLNSYLAETVYPISGRNYLTARWELVDKDELSVPGIFRIGAYTAGYTRDIGSLPYLQTGIGANVTAYTLPGNLKPYYGDRPWGINLYVRLRLIKPDDMHMKM